MGLRWSIRASCATAVLGLCMISAHAGDVAVVARGPSPYALQLESVVAGSSSPASPVAALPGPIALIDIGLSNWLPQRRLDDEVPRLVELGMDALHGILLPGEVGGLILHYSRMDSTIYGFVRIKPDGAVQIILERPGVSWDGKVNPFDPVIAVDPEGEMIAISGAPAWLPQGQPAHLWVVATLGGTSVAHDVIPSSFGPPIPGTSIHVDDDVLVALRGTSVLVADVEDAEPADVVPLDASPPIALNLVLPEIALSGDGSKAVVVAGSDYYNLHLYAIDVSALTSTRITNTPSRILGTGTALGSDQAPFLALDEIGSSVAFQSMELYDAELYVQDLAPGSVPKHITNDAVFDPYIDTVSGVFPTASRFAYFGWGGATSAADLYVTDLGTVPSAPQSMNITSTSGTPLPPFADLGLIDVAAYSMLESNMLIADDRTTQGGGYQYWAVQDLQNAQMIVPGLVSPPQFSSAREDGPAMVGLFRLPTLNALARVSTDPFVAIPTPLLVVPAPIEFDHLAVDRSGNRVAFAARLAPGVEYVAMMTLPAGTLRLPPNGPFGKVHEVRFTDAGTLLFTTSSGTGDRTSHAFDPVTGLVSSTPPALYSMWLR